MKNLYQCNLSINNYGKSKKADLIEALNGKGNELLSIVVTSSARGTKVFPYMSLDKADRSYQKVYNQLVEYFSEINLEFKYYKKVDNKATLVKAVNEIVVAADNKYYISFHFTNKINMTNLTKAFFPKEVELEEPVMTLHNLGDKYTSEKDKKELAEMVSVGGRLTFDAQDVVNTTIKEVDNTKGDTDNIKKEYVFKFIKLATIDNPNVEGHVLEYVNKPRAVAAAVITKDGKNTICVKQFRVGPMKEVYGFPAGLLDSPDENPMDAIMREISEEIGYTGSLNKIDEIGPYYTSQGYSTEALTLYVFQMTEEYDIEEGRKNQQLDSTERLTVELVPLHKLVEKEFRFNFGMSGNLIIESVIKHFNTKRKIAIYGGSFNPITAQHLAVIQELKDEYDFERIIIEPVHDKYINSKYKDVKRHTVSGNHRRNMINLALVESGMQYFTAIGNFEMDSMFQPLSITTMRYYDDLYKNENVELYYVLGSDNLENISEWEAGLELVDKFNIISVDIKDGHTNNIIMNSNDLIERRHKIQTLTSQPKLKISATLIRNRIGVGKSIKFLTTNAVCNYITANELYAIEK